MPPRQTALFCRSALRAHSFCRMGPMAAVTEFGGPACQPASDKIIVHGISMGGRRENYAKILDKNLEAYVYFGLSLHGSCDKIIEM